MRKRELTCIGCPMGCALTVTLEEGQVMDITGYTCRRGRDYGEKECTHPMRTVTSSVPVEGGVLRMVSVKTASDIPKEKISACMEAIHACRITAPVRIGQVLLQDVAETGTALVATKSVSAQQ